MLTKALVRLRRRRAWWVENPPTNGLSILKMYQELDSIQAEADEAAVNVQRLNLQMTTDLEW